jgi:hypothetical protein
VNVHGEAEDTVLSPKSNNEEASLSSPAARGAGADSSAGAPLSPPSYDEAMIIKASSPPPTRNPPAAVTEMDSLQDAAFAPTDVWLAAVKAELPVATISRLLKHLGPQVDELATNSSTVDELQVMEFIRKTTMVGLLPVPHPIGNFASSLFRVVPYIECCA